MMQLSAEEMAGKQLAPATLALAAQQIKMNGYVIFERVIAPDLVAELHAGFVEIFNAHSAANPSNRGVNRYQMHLPFRAPFCRPEIVDNPFAVAIMQHLLGEDCVCHYFASDTPLPGSDYQKVHSDIRRLFPESDIVLPPFSIVLNIPLVDFRTDNGPLEIWPGGTHLMPGGVNMEQLAPLMHSEPVLVPAGSLIIRDMRMWHRGTPNRSQELRPNLALIYSRGWLKTDYPPIAIPKPAYDALSPRAQRLFRYERIGA